MEGLTVISSVEDPPKVLTVTFAMPLALVRPLTPPGLTSTSTFTAGVWSGFVTYTFYQTKAKNKTKSDLS